MHSDSDPVPRDHIEFLAGSDIRVQLLRHLHEQPARSTDLVEHSTASRSTVHRTINALNKRGWVYKDHGHYQLSPCGERILSKYEELITTIDVTSEYQRFLQRLGPHGSDLPTEALADATIVSITPEDPHAAVVHLVDVLATVSTDRFLAITPIVSTLFNNAAGKLVEAGTPTELVMDESVLEVSQNEFADAYSDARSFENMTLYVYPTRIQFGLVIFDSRVLLYTYDDQGLLHDCLDGTNEALLDWAESTYDIYRRDATSLDAKIRSD